MFIPTPEAHSRSIVKAISWRLLGSLDTFMISTFITHNWKAGASIASVETVTKLILYYTHERVWTLVPLGRRDAVVKD